MGEAITNGEAPHSATLEHIQKYPIVADSISTFKSYSLGKQSIDLTNAAYNNFVKPTLPYLETPASYAKPYVSKADEIGDNLLSKVDEQIPIVKSETKDIQSTLQGYIGYPFQLFDDGKSYVFKTYDEQYKQCGGDGIVAGSKALVTTSLLIASQTTHYLASLLQQKEKEAKDIIAQKSAEVRDAVNEKTK